MTHRPATPHGFGYAVVHPQGDLSGGDNIVAKLNSRIREVRRQGFQVRQEVLGGHQSSWCEIGGKKILFLDASQTAREQLAAIDEALAGYQSVSHGTNS
jgi:hypothetical protein